MDLSGAVWRKSSYSSGGGNACVEVAPASNSIAIRDSKDPDGGILVVDPGAFRDLTARIKQRG
ncbi:MAG: DUF397 domain-containing protein [Streptosporangiaceae bacterium]|nr:DUF397 domain-containing protein [Streptosporangiaceae bacterium]